MRKFKRRERKKVKKSIFTAKNIVGAVIAFIMVFSIVGIVANNNNTGSQTDEYQEYKLTRVGNQWFTTIGDEHAKFRFHPDVVDETYLTNDAVELIRETRFAFIAFKPDDPNIKNVEQVRLELEEELPLHFETYTASGTEFESEDYPVLPIITCDNATASVPVIMIRTGDEDKFVFEDNCLEIIGSDGNGIYLLKDRLMYGLFRMIE